MGWFWSKKAVPPVETTPLFDRDETLARSRAQLAAGGLDEAEAGFKSILAENTNDSEGLHGLAAVFVAKGFRQQAILTCNRALAVNPDDAEARKLLAEVMKTGG
jgi:Flp pilus assembly protein TadD